MRPLAIGGIVLVAAYTSSLSSQMPPADAPRPHVTWAEISAQPAAPHDARIAYGDDPLQFGELRLPPGPGPFPVAVVIHGGCWRAAYDLAHVAPVAAALTREGIATWSIEYRRVGDDPLQFGELRLPPGPGPFPVAVVIHGGCWRAAYDLAHVAPVAAALTREGIATWSIEYRRVGDDSGGWPGTFEDVARAVDHVRELARRSPLDTARVVLVGHSAGGQLALWAGSRRTGERGAMGSDAPLRAAGVVALAPITDLAAYGAAPGGCNSAVTPLMGGTGGDVPDRYAAVSPVDRIPLGVPAAIVHGAEDPTVPVAASREFAGKARAAGDAVELREVPGAGHFDVVAPFAPAWKEVMAAIRAVLERR